MPTSSAVLSATFCNANSNATVIVENRAGAGGGTGATAVARSEADGYTLLIGSNGPLTVNPFVIANLGYDPLKDFAAVALTSYVPHVLILSNNTPAKNLTELVALSKKAPLNIGTSGTGSAGHMTLERFKAATGANLTHVPYKSGGTLVPDVLSGTINGAMTELSIALPLHKDKKAFIPAIASRARNKLAPRRSDLRRKRREGLLRGELCRRAGPGQDAAGYHREGAEGD